MSWRIMRRICLGAKFIRRVGDKAMKWKGTGKRRGGGCFVWQWWRMHRSAARWSVARILRMVSCISLLIVRMLGFALTMNYMADFRICVGQRVALAYRGIPSLYYSLSEARREAVASIATRWTLWKNRTMEHKRNRPDEAIPVGMTWETSFATSLLYFL